MQQTTENSQYYSLEILPSLDFGNIGEQLTKQDHRHADPKSAEITVTTQLQEEKTLIRWETTPDCKLDQSEIQDYANFINNMPDFPREECGFLVKSISCSPYSPKTKEQSPSLINLRLKKMNQSNWFSHYELKCLVEFNNTKIKTVCKIKDAEMQFQEGLQSFRLSKIIKIKVLFQNNQKCLCFTYDQTLSKKTTQIKFKLFVQNNAPDDLYVIFSKIVLQKMALLDYLVDPYQKEQKNVNRQVMAGQLYKMSQFTREWKKRRLVLTDKIQSFKGQKCTYEMKNIRELWTRFEFFQKCLVVKLRHGLQKTQLALPIVNYSVKFARNNWLYRIFRILVSS